MMRKATTIYILGFASIFLAPVWGAGLLAGWYALKMSKAEQQSDRWNDERVRRDVRGGRVLSYIGCGLSAIVLAVALYSIIVTSIIL
jgi:hypothetical protein